LFFFFFLSFSSFSIFVECTLFPQIWLLTIRFLLLRVNRKGNEIHSVPTDESIEAEEERGKKEISQREGAQVHSKQANIPNPQTDASGTNPAE
jgi:hypothetical protein